MKPSAFRDIKIYHGSGDIIKYPRQKTFCGDFTALKVLTNPNVGRTHAKAHRYDIGDRVRITQTSMLLTKQAGVHTIRQFFMHTTVNPLYQSASDFIDYTTLIRDVATKRKGKGKPTAKGKMKSCRRETSPKANKQCNGNIALILLKKGNKNMYKYLRAVLAMRARQIPTGWIKHFVRTGQPVLIDANGLCHSLQPVRDSEIINTIYVFKCSHPEVLVYLVRESHQCCVLYSVERGKLDEHIHQYYRYPV